MTRKAKITIFILALLWIWIYAIFWKQETRADQPKSDKEIYIEKWEQIGAYKYEEMKAEKTMIEAKTKKDALLQELNNWSGFTK